MFCIFVIFVVVMFQSEAASHADHSVSALALGAALNNVLLAESLRNSSQGEKPSAAVSEQQRPVTNDLDPSDLSGSVSQCVARSDSDELMYEILPFRLNRRNVLSSDYNEPMYEISSTPERSGTSTPQVVPYDTSSVQSQDDDDYASVPQVPARPSVSPSVPSPIGSPAPAPRKISKGHLDVSKLTQVVLPPSTGTNRSVSSSPTPPVTVPRVPPRLGTSQSVNTPSTPVPVVLPRKRSEVQSVHHTRSRRLPPPPMPPPVPESHILNTDDPTILRTADVPVLPTRTIRQQSSVSADRKAAASRSTAKRPSVGALRGYEEKCVEVDSGKPSRLPLKSALSRYLEIGVFSLFYNLQHGIPCFTYSLVIWRMV